MRATPIQILEALDALTNSAQLRDSAEATFPELVNRAIEVGCTWSQIARALGVTKSSAWERYHAGARP